MKGTIGWVVLSVMMGVAVIVYGDSPPVSSDDLRAGHEREFEIAPGVTMVFCWIPATVSDEWREISGGEDSFVMGSPREEVGHDTLNKDEIQREVRLTRGYWMGKYEVTQKQWQAIMKTNPSHIRGPLYPVGNVSWQDCQEFVAKLKGPYRLPTEAEWEYACRAGSRGPYHGELDSVSRFLKNSGNAPHAVGGKQPNAWGLHDMHGNVHEWCLDAYAVYSPENAEDPIIRTEEPILFVYRGGSWFSTDLCCRSAWRLGFAGTDRFITLGFRLMRESEARDKPER